MPNAQRNGYPTTSGDGSTGRPARPSRPSIPRPANDNLPRPANDNLPRAARGVAARTGVRATAGFALRAAGRALPAVGIAIAAYDLWQIYNGWSPQPPGYDMAGWNKRWGPYTYTLQNGNPTKDSFFRDYIDRRMPPLGPGPLSRQVYLGPITVTAATTGVSLVEVYDYTTLQANKLRYISGWTRPVGATQNPTVLPQGYPTSHPMPGAPRVRGGTFINPANNPGGAPDFPPWVDPLSYPPGSPMPEAQPPPYEAIPYRQPNPWRSPYESTDIGPGPSPRPRPSVAPQPFPMPPPVVIGTPTPLAPVGDPVTRPDTRPEPGPGEVTSPGGQPNPSTSPSPDPPPRREPPRRDEDELKVKIRRNGVVIAVANIAGVTTETLDFINVMYDALPKSCKPGYYQLTGKGGVKFYKRRWRANQSQRIKAIASCYQQSDVTKLVKGFIWNHFEDKLIGRGGRAAKKAFETSGSTRPVGLQAGPWDTMSSKAYQEYRRREEDRAERERDAARAEAKRRQAIIRSQKRSVNQAAWRKKTRRTGRNPWG